MKNWNKEKQEFVEEAARTAGKILAKTMFMLEIPNHIKSGFEMGGYSFKLKFTRRKIKL